MFNSLIQCQIQGEIERPNKCYFLCLKFYIEPKKRVPFHVMKPVPAPPPILSQVNLNLALLDLYSIPSDFCIILEWYSVYGPYGMFVFICNAYSFISYRQGLCLLYIYCIYCTKMVFFKYCLNWNVLLKYIHWTVEDWQMINCLYWGFFDIAYNKNIQQL